MKRKFFVALNVEIDGQVCEHGSTIELDVETAKLYNHALRLVEEETDGRNA
jgi:hypothetical protein